MSHLAWVDFDREAQRAAQEMMAQLNAPEARDELGLGTVRDGLADLLFPGTSTIQTRLHYMLFIPWIWRMAASVRGATPVKRIDRARKLEFQLCEALMRNGETDGVIGRVAGKSLKRLPSGVYWAGLENWGIRLGKESPERTLSAGLRDGLWAEGADEIPTGFPANATFTLRDEDTIFLRDRMVSRSTALADLTLRGDKEEIEEAAYPWEIDGAVFSTDNQHLLTLARGFAQGMQGARLLYNLIAAERAATLENAKCHGEAEVLIEIYSEKIDEWADAVEFSSWHPDQVYEAVRLTGRTPGDKLRTFVDGWIALAGPDPHGIPENKAARALIIRRERALKRGRTARLSDDDALARWGGASGADTLEYRWNTARQFLLDLGNAR